jgi:hypothetical protein
MVQFTAYHEEGRLRTTVDAQRLTAVAESVVDGAVASGYDT